MPKNHRLKGVFVNQKEFGGIESIYFVINVDNFFITAATTWNLSAESIDH